MEATVRLYTLNYDEAKTYLWAAVFVVCNLVLPQVFHLIPQGGIIFAPLSLVIVRTVPNRSFLKILICFIVKNLKSSYLSGRDVLSPLEVSDGKSAQRLCD